MIKILKKYSFISKDLLRNTNKILKTRNKSTTLLSKFNNNKIFVYNGKTYVSYFINSKKLMYKIGNFIFTKNLSINYN